jgi:hypothetical protein
VEVVATGAFSWALGFLPRSLRLRVWGRGSLGVWRINLVWRGELLRRCVGNGNAGGIEEARRKVTGGWLDGWGRREGWSSVE